jgi:D-beta-D-heptose 7-phosphate kinase/D-beta-D-heptose 1-phosphate adenosyltransferase
VSGAPGRLVIVGDTLLDRDVDGSVRRVCPDAPAPVLDEESTSDRPGGAGLAALLSVGHGYDVVLVTALADDAGGARLTELLTAAGVQVYPLPLPGRTPEKVRLRARGQVLLRLDRGGAGSPVPGDAPQATLAVLRDATAILVSDYGRGVARHPQLRAALAQAAAPVVWDPHPRGPAPVPGARLVTPNESEARAMADDAGNGPALATAVRAGQRLRERWRADAVAVTRGAHGAVLCRTGPTPLVVPATPADGDTCGAGDRFAATAALALADGVLVAGAVERAVAQAAAYVAAGGVEAALAQHGIRRHQPAERNRGVDRNRGARRNRPTRAGVAVRGTPAGPWGSWDGQATGTAELLAGVRERGGTIVATGGCFDLLHAGHLATLQAARHLGDCLVVCLNSDASVAGLKGPERPLTPQADRGRLLAALDCVDAVVVFDEPTPEAVLSWIRPDVWVKGGDYADGGPELPEAGLLRRWGGQTVVVPYLDGRSTTRMIAAARAGDSLIREGVA